jgi:predicted ATPase
LAKLQLTEFIYERPAFPDSEYTFKHALTQEVAYNSVLMERRRELHERSAAAIEELFADKLDDHIDALAHHYSRSGNAPKAVGFLRLAAEQARTRSAYDDAYRYVNEAPRLLAEIPESLQRDRDEVALQGIRGPLLIATEGYASAELSQCLNRALALCKRIGEGPELFGVMVGLWSFNLARNRLHDAMVYYDEIYKPHIKKAEIGRKLLSEIDDGDINLWKLEIECKRTPNKEPLSTRRKNMSLDVLCQTLTLSQTPRPNERQASDRRSSL